MEKYFNTNIKKLLIELISLYNIKHYIFFVFILLFLSICYLILSCNNLFQFLLAIELILVNISFIFLLLSVFFYNIEGFIVVISIICIATVETVIGLSLFIKIELLNDFQKIKKIKNI